MHVYGRKLTAKETRMSGIEAIELSGIYKSFSGVDVLKNIDFSVGKGEIRALLGANGAGKSTLIKVATGVYLPDRGGIKINGQACSFKSPIDSFNAGIAVVHQETSLIPTSTALQNVFMAREYKKASFILDEKTMLKKYNQLAQKLNVNVAPDKIVRELGSAEKKLVEIMKAVSRNSSIIIMDEPTDSLSKNEVDSLFRLILELKNAGITIVYITHFLEEVAKIADTVTVLRDGQLIDTLPAKGLSTFHIVNLILGKEIMTREAEERKHVSKTARLSVKNLSRKNEFSAINFDLYPGEVLGIVGVVGSGKSELANTLAGAKIVHGGQIELNGQPVILKNPNKAIKLGIGLAPEDRKTQGLFLDHDLGFNVSLPSLKRFSRHGIISKKKEKLAVKAELDRLQTSYSSLTQKARYLSGGNQQKCVLGRWLMAAPGILILDEPTRGVDVGVKSELYNMVRQLSEKGNSIIYCSGEPEEILAVADRIMVMQKGKIKKQYDTKPLERELLNAMLEVNNV